MKDRREKKKRKSEYNCHKTKHNLIRKLKLPLNNNVDKKINQNETKINFTKLLFL